MENGTTAVETVPPAPAAKPVQPEPKGALALDAGGSLKLTTLAEALRYAQAIVDSGLAPKGDTAAAVLIKMQAGAELGFPPMRALASLVVVNGKLTLQGDAMLALIRSSGRGRVMVGLAGEGDARHGWCEVERFDTGEKDRLTFSMADAKKAGLVGGGKENAWKGYADDMLRWKAVARASKLYFSDVLGGIESAEEARTYEPTPYTPISVVPPRALPAPPVGEDPLLVTPTSAESTPAAPAAEGPPVDCAHPGLPAGMLDNMAEGEMSVCQDCGEEIKGPGRITREKAEKAKAGKQGRLA